MPPRTRQWASVPNRDFDTIAQQQRFAAIIAGRANDA